MEGTAGEDDAEEDEESNARCALHLLGTLGLGCAVATRPFTQTLRELLIMSKDCF